MRRFVTLSFLLLFSIPFGVSISGCSKKAALVFCNGGDSGLVSGQVTNITLGPIIYGVSLNYAQISQVNQPSPTDCKGQSAFAGVFTYATTDMTIADVQPSSGRICGGTWNRNTGGGIPDYTFCNPALKPGTAYITASAGGVTSNPLPIFVHPVVTSIVLGADSSSAASAPLTASITAYSITANTPTFTAPNSYAPGQVLSLYGFPNSTFLDGITTAVVQAANPTQFTVSIPGFTHPNISTLETGFAGAPDCATNPTTACCPLTTIGSPTAATYVPTSCISQGQTRQLAARVYAGTGANQTNISCQAGHLIFSSSDSSGNGVSSVVSVDPNGIATAVQPGSALLSANISTAASSAGFFSTCPPASIQLSAPGAVTNSAGAVVVNQNNVQPLVATALDTNGVALTGLNLQYDSTSPSTIPAGTGGSITPLLAGSAAITATCQPPSCNPSAYNQIGLFGNGKPVTSNSVNLTVPGTNSTVLYMASTQSLYMESRDFTQSSMAPALLLPYLPNSMIISNDGSSIYMGSTTALMVLSAGSSLSILRVDPTSEGTVLAVSPNGSQIVISDPIKQITTIELSAGNVVTTYGGVGTRAQFSPDGSTVYIAAGNQLLIYSAFTGWDSITPTSSLPNSDPPPFPVTDVAVTVPAVGAYLAGSTTTARSYCAISTLTSPAGSANPLEVNEFFPQADSLGVTNDRIAATNDGLHILGATVTTTTPTLNDLHVQVPLNPGPGGSVACPPTPLNPADPLRFSSTSFPKPLTAITASAINGVLPTSDSSLAFITYQGSGGFLPAYAPAAGTVTNIPLTGGAALAPISGVLSADNTLFFAGTSGDDKVHIITRSTLTDSATPLTPNLILLVPTTPATFAPVDLIVQKPRKTT